MSGANVDADNAIHFPEQIESLLPSFATRPYSHLPTPQSPNTLGRYLVEHPPSPETPIPHSVSSFITPSTPSDRQRHGSWRFVAGDKSVRLSSTTQQYATPESSPLFQHIAQLPESNSATPRYSFQTSTEFSTPKQMSCMQIEPAQNGSQSPLDSSPTTAHSLHSSALSSPFMGRMTLDDHNVEKNRSNLPVEDVDVFSAPKSHYQVATALSTPPISPPRDPPSTSAIVQAGGEMERIRNAMREEALNRIQEAEIRRPDYLKRAKRTFAETEPTYFVDDPSDDRWPSLGVTDSPQKGRRLKLFQETSDESFEESLMAGGYGRYRTADWVRQPQPISIPPNIGGSSVVVSLLEKAEEAPPTEKEVKKQKRLAAFRSQSQPGNLNIAPIEMQGKGRVLMEIQSGERDSPEPSPSKRKAASRRKKKVADGSINRKSKFSGSPHEQLEKPNWPDTEFPWRLRAEERIEEANAEKEERLKWIERYLDRDSDDDDDEQVALRDEQATSAVLYDKVSKTSYQVKMGRGKMIPLSVAPDDPWNLIPKRPFPVDPADARQALLSKKSVRTLSYRQQKRLRQEDEEDEDEEVLCICHGKDDGRELVQCDTCHTWYHLACIGIKNIAELGREEDPWFCGRCTRNRSPSIEVAELPTSEPTFVPSEPPSSIRHSSDATFFHLTAPDSPNWTRMPKTPTRGVHSSSDFSRPAWNWMDPSRPMPSTPHRPLVAHKVHSTPGAFEVQNSNYYDESPFDPTSTPSRGIKLPVAFATPKLSAWPPRSNPLLQTPSRTSGRAGTNRFHVPHSASLDEGSIGNGVQSYSFARVLASDESPIRRNKSSDATFGRRRLLSPSQLPS